MPSEQPCQNVRAETDAHFAGSATPTGEQRMRAHLVGCSDCRAYYERHLVLARLDRSVPSAMERGAIGLGFTSASSPSQSRSRTLLRTGAVASGVVAAAAALFLVLGRPHDRSLEFAARGAGDNEITVGGASVTVYRVRAGQRSEPFWVSTGEMLAPKEELAFGYENRAGYRYLMIFARDAKQQIFWYYPAWADAGSTPTAMPIESTATPQSLPDAVSHDFAPGPLELFALFSNERRDVREVERALASSGASDFSAPNSLVWRRQLTVAAP